MQWVMTGTFKYDDNISSGLDLKEKKNVTEPCDDKMCLWESLTRPDTNRPAQLQRLARVLKFRL